MHSKQWTRSPGSKACACSSLHFFLLFSSLLCSLLSLVSSCLLAFSLCVLALLISEFSHVSLFFYSPSICVFWLFRSLPPFFASLTLTRGATSATWGVIVQAIWERMECTFRRCQPSQRRCTNRLRNRRRRGNRKSDPISWTNMVELNISTYVTYALDSVLYLSIFRFSLSLLSFELFLAFVLWMSPLCFFLYFFVRRP